MALEGRMLREHYTIWSLLGDGEINEGLIWEAAMGAGKIQARQLLFTSSIEMACRPMAHAKT